MTLAQSDFQFRTSKGACLLQMIRGKGMLIFVDGQPAGEVAQEIVTTAMADPKSAADYLAGRVEDIAGQMEGRDALVLVIADWLQEHPGTAR